MSDKQQMDDFASLFLPDLLNRLDALPEQETATKHPDATREPASDQGPSPVPSNTSSGMSLMRFFEASQQVSSNEAETRAMPSAFSEDPHPYLPECAGGTGGSASIGVGVGVGGGVGVGVGSSVGGGSSSSGGPGPGLSVHGSMAPWAQANSFRARNRPDAFPDKHRGGPEFHRSSNPNNAAVYTYTNGPANNTGYSNASLGSAPFNNVSLNNTPTHGISPLSGLDMGHTSHYAEYGPSEASYQQPSRQRPYHVAQFQSPYPTAGHNSFENGPWSNSADSAALNKSWYGPSPGLCCGPSSMDMYAADQFNIAWPGSRMKKVPEAVTPIKTPNHDKSSKPPKHNRSKPPTSASGQSIRVDYSTSTLDQLVDLKRTTPNGDVSVVSSSGEKVNFSLRGFLHGRLLTNDQDNYNYILLSSGAVDPASVYHPQVISCYRRNFINLHLHLAVDSPTTEMVIDGQKIQRIRTEITAVTDKRDPKPVALLDNEFEPDPKDTRVSGDNIVVEVISPNHVIELADLKEECFMKVKKLQFKSATANSTNLTFQTYYRFVVRIIAETEFGDHSIEELVSNPIIVRGRNPSFYQSKNDVLIKGKSPQSVSSYQQANLSMPLFSIGTEDHDTSTTSEIPIVDSTGEQSLAIAEEDSVIKSEEISTEFLSKSEASNTERFHDGGDEDIESDEGGEEEHDDLEESAVIPPKDEARVSNFPGGADIRKILDAMSEKKGEKYHYFPISNVYYLPPINVVYFPHAAHHTGTETEEASRTVKSEAPMSSPSSQVTSDRKSSSKVYFR
ncbi:hypothetical protein JCM33374_g660 [Metschnikowia sp. JCM 33374]|nr:hypothetical protein JCM33374_g660 [Metschnikowia sp. JCM 33374]